MCMYFQKLLKNRPDQITYQILVQSLNHPLLCLSICLSPSQLHNSLDTHTHTHFDTHTHTLRHTHTSTHTHTSRSKVETLLFHKQQVSVFISLFPFYWWLLTVNLKCNLAQIVVCVCVCVCAHVILGNLF